MTIVKSIAIFLAAGGLILWGAAKLPHLSFGVASQQPAAALAAAGDSKLPASDDGYATLEGTVVLDTHTSESVPFIAYLYKQGVTRTKELLLDGKRGCDTQVGDLPCASEPSQQYPSLSPGEHIRVTGTIKGDQILVDSIQPL